VPFLHEGRIASQHGEAMCATLLTNWMIVCTNPIWCSSWALWKYTCIKSEILLCWSKIWKTSPLKGLLALAIWKFEKKMFNFYFRWKNARNLTRNPLWIYRCIRSDIFSITLQFEPQMHKEMY
jgi:hypothetical protein